MIQPSVLPKLILLFVHTGQLSGLLLTSIICEHTTCKLCHALHGKSSCVEYMDISTVNLPEEFLYLSNSLFAQLLALRQ